MCTGMNFIVIRQNMYLIEVQVVTIFVKAQDPTAGNDTNTVHRERGKKRHAKQQLRNPTGGRGLRRGRRRFRNAPPTPWLQGQSRNEGSGRKSSQIGPPDLGALGKPGGILEIFLKLVSSNHSPRQFPR